LDDSSIDLIYADWVLEHVKDPTFFFSEIGRTLKPGGWFCARTPNRWGIIGLATTLIPNGMHTRILKHLQPERNDVDIFPTAYKANTIGQMKRLLPENEWRHL